MNRISKTILFGTVLAALFLSSGEFACFAETFACFSDTEISIGNTITTAAGYNDADFLIVSDSKLTGNGEKLHGITLDVSGTQSITIDKIQVWWDIPLGDTSNITEIKLDGKEFFSGSKSVGEVLDGTDYVLEEGSSAKLEFYFDSDVSDLVPFTINIIMGDRSVKSFVTDPKYRSDVPETSEADTESSQDVQEAAVTDTESSQEVQEAAEADTESSQEVQEAAEADTESSQDAQEAAVTDTESSQDVQEAPVTDTESSQDEQETPLDKN